MLNFADSGENKLPEYTQDISDRIYIPSYFKAERFSDKKKIANIIDNYRSNNPRLIPNDSLNIQVCGNCAFIQKSFYFNSDPNEICIVNFDFNGITYIDNYFKKVNDTFIETRLNQIEESEKNRLQNRVDSVIKNIDWKKYSK